LRYKVKIPEDRVTFTVLLWFKPFLRYMPSEPMIPYPAVPSPLVLDNVVSRDTNGVLLVPVRAQNVYPNDPCNAYLYLPSA
jgi:hypothetical protein